MYTKSYHEKRRRIVRRFTRFGETYPPARQRHVKLRAAAAAFLASIPEPHCSPVHAGSSARALYRLIMADLCKHFGAQTTINEIIHDPALLQEWLVANR